MTATNKYLEKIASADSDVQKARLQGAAISGAAGGLVGGGVAELYHRSSQAAIKHDMASSRDRAAKAVDDLPNPKSKYYDKALGKLEAELASQKANKLRSEALSAAKGRHVRLAAGVLGSLSAMGSYAHSKEAEDQSKMDILARRVVDPVPWVIKAEAGLVAPGNVGAKLATIAAAKAYKEMRGDNSPV